MQSRETSLVPVKDLPAGHRVMFGLSNLGRVAAIAEKEQRDDRSIRNVIHDAVRYVTPLAQQIAEGLSPVQELLRHHKRSVAEAPNIVKEVERTVDQAADRKLYSRQQHTDPAQRARQLARDIARYVHPDTAVTQTTAEGATTVDPAYTLQQTRKAIESGDATEAQSLLLQTAPQVLINKVKRFLAEGQSFEQIAADNPDLVTEMGILHEMAYLQYGEFGSLDRPQTRKTKLLKTPEDAEREATRLKAKDDRNARIMGLSMSYQVFTEAVQTLPTDGADIARLEAIKTAMERAGGVVGGLDEFFAQHGTRFSNNRLQTRLEDFIIALPERIFQVAQGLIDGADIETAAEALLTSVREVELTGRSYIYTIEEAANPVESYKKKPINNYDEKIIFKKENRYNKQNYN